MPCVRSGFWGCAANIHTARLDFSVAATTIRMRLEEATLAGSGVTACTA
jgi:hypothetical protein